MFSIFDALRACTLLVISMSVMVSELKILSLRLSSFYVFRQHPAHTCNTKVKLFNIGFSGYLSPFVCYISYSQLEVLGKKRFPAFLSFCLRCESMQTYKLRFCSKETNKIHCSTPNSEVFKTYLSRLWGVYFLDSRPQCSLPARLQPFLNNTFCMSLIFS